MNKHIELQDCTNCHEEHAVAVKKLESGKEHRSCMYCGIIEISECNKVETHKPFGVLDTKLASRIENEALTRAREDAVLSTRINDNSTRITDLDNKFTGEVERLDQRIDTIEWKIEDVEKRMSGGIAATAAIAGMVQPKYVDETMVSVGTGYYNGQSALAIGITHNYLEKTAFKFAAATYSASD